MRILHYTIGFPPARTGRLVKYVLDLVKIQKNSGLDVIVLFPGRINIFSPYSYIKKKTHIDTDVYELFNSLPLPLVGGINNPKDFTKQTPKKVYETFLDKVKPDLIHVHSLMGIHKEFFVVAKEKNIPIIFTTHDYFGLAPEPNFFFKGTDYSYDNTIENWVNASAQSLSTKKLRLFQSRLYPLIRFLITNFKKFRVEHVSSSCNQGTKANNKKWDEYRALKEYYRDLFSLISIFHFNSSVSKNVFLHNLGDNINFFLLPLSNMSITNNCKQKYNCDKTRVAYIGPNKEYKGFDIFCELAERFCGSKYEFHTYGYTQQDRDPENQGYITEHGRYRSSIEDMYRSIDILIVPSLWRETLGFVALEALSNCTTVFVSKNVGARDFLKKYYVFEDKEDLFKKFSNLDKKEPCYIKTIPTLKEHWDVLQKNYGDLIQENEERLDTL